MDPATNNEQQVHLVDLQTGSAEYNNVLKEFQKTMVQGKSYNNIVKIQRVQNPALYAQYIVKKAVMDKHIHGHQNERRLFHGTEMSSCPKINTTNINRSFAGQNGKSATCVVVIMLSVLAVFDLFLQHMPIVEPLQSLQSRPT